MKQTRLMMDMPITVEIIDSHVTQETFEKIFNYFKYVDNKFSTFKKDSEISKINQGKLGKDRYSEDMETVLLLCEETKKETKGFFNIEKNGFLDPSGLVKGWSVFRAIKMLKDLGFKNFYIAAGGDIQAEGKNSQGKKWTIGIRNPFNRNEVVKVIAVSGKGVATSGTYFRGQHVYNPFEKGKEIRDIVSLTVIGPNILEADRFATAAFAMGKRGIEFIENLEGFEGYMIDKQGIATFTRGFNDYVKSN